MGSSLPYDEGKGINLVRLKAEQRVPVRKQDLEAMRAFHVCPRAHVVVVLRNGGPIFARDTREVFDIPEYWQPGMKMYTPSYVLGDGTWWKWIKALYGGNVPLRTRPTEEEK